MVVHNSAIVAEVVRSHIILDKQHLHVESPRFSDGLEVECD